MLMTALTEAICGTVPGSLPAEARERAHASILDGIGVALAGSGERAPRIAREVALRQGGRDVATIWGTSLRASTLDAILVNGIATHVLDLDDTNFSLFGHATGSLIAALFAIAEERNLSGRAVVEAFIVGFEVACKLGTVMNLDHYERGWHTSSTLGTIGVAAGVGWMLRLDPVRMASALALAASTSSGLVRNFGSMAKAFHIGHAARSGAFAALLAESGFTGNPEVLETGDGFVEIFSGRPGSDLARLIERWGEPWDIVQPGVDFKLYPSCTLTHAPIDAALALVREHAIRPENIETITCYHTYRVPMVLLYREPVNSLQAKFSMEYALAVAFTDGAAGIPQFMDERVVQPDVQALSRRVRYHVHPDLTTRESLANAFAIVQVETKKGGRFEKRVGAPRGSASNPIESAELSEKFLTCATRALPDSAVATALSILQELESFEDVRPLMQAISSVGDEPAN